MKHTVGMPYWMFALIALFAIPMVFAIRRNGRLPWIPPPAPWSLESPYYDPKTNPILDRPLSGR